MRRKVFAPTTVNGFDAGGVQITNDTSGVWGTFESTGPPPVWSIGDNVEIKDASGTRLAAGYIRRISVSSGPLGLTTHVEWSGAPVPAWPLGMSAAAIIDSFAEELARKRRA